ncbi:MAG: lipocalin family protein [Bacteriovoracia bacterium]
MLYKSLFATILFASLFSALAQAEPRTVPFVDVNRYIAGPWYEISANPMPFEKDCTCSRQVLGLESDGRLNVRNTCNDKTQRGPVREVKGFATNDDTASNAKFTVDFGFPIKGKYWIIALDPAYQWAVVSDPTELSLFVLSKTPTLDPALYDAAIAEASSAGQVDTSKLVSMQQTGCSYPAQ